MTKGVTDDDARKRACCDGTRRPGACVGAWCMAWRWLPLMVDDAVKKATLELPPDRKVAAVHVNANRAQYELPTDPYLGFCGLAGVPDA